MPIILDRSICCDLNETIGREWFISNNLGGYAAGTVAGVLTRTQHGVLVAIPPTANVPHVLLAKIDEEIDFDQRTYHLGTNEYRDGTLNPAGFVHLESFRLEEGFPIFTYRLGGIDGVMLEKRIWMPQGENTTYIQYRVLRTASQEGANYRKSGPLTGHRSGPLRLSSPDESKGPPVQITLLPFSAYRPYNQAQFGSNKRHFQVEVHALEEAPGRYDARRIAGCTIKAEEEAYPYHILAVGHPENRATCIPTGVWYWHFLHRKDAEEGKGAIDDLYLPGVIRATLWPGKECVLTVVVSIEDLSTLHLHSNQLSQSYQKSVERQQELLQSILRPSRYFGESGEAVRAHHLQVLPLATTSDPYAGGKEYLSQLLQAGDRFLTRRRRLHTKSEKPPDVFFGRSHDITALHAGYYDMEVRLRDALIALPGLTLVTERYDEALRLLREFANHFRSGLLPDCLPMVASIDSIDQSEYRSADTTLWYFYALDYYLRVTQNYQFLEDFFHVLTNTINNYIQGTLNGIRVDPKDGLLYAGEPGKAATWMNAMVDGNPVTERRGKAVEINALWYHALSLMHEWSQYLNHIGYFSYHTSYYQELRTLCKESFQQRFWYGRGKYLYDVVDGPMGDDPALRPNQILALSLRHCLLKQELWQSVFEAVTQHLLTPYGLRTLSPEDAGYRGRMGEDQRSQRTALHQGSVWSWLIGPYIEAMLTVRCGPMEAKRSHNHYLCREYLWRKGICLLEPFRTHLKEGTLGVNRSVFDGDKPYRADENTVSSTSTGELLRIYSVLSHMSVIGPVFSHTLHR